MSLEISLQENTAALQAHTEVMRALMARLTGTPATDLAPGVAQLIEAQRALNAKEADAKKPDTANDAPADNAPTSESQKPGEVSAQTPASSSPEPKLHDWHAATASAYAELKDAPRTLDTAKKSLLAINSRINREQATAALARFGAQAITTKDGARGLDEAQYPEFVAYCLDILAGRVDATEAVIEHA
ncbi:MAG: hypothetical protein VB131_01225 [Burkholderia gladioli]